MSTYYNGCMDQIELRGLRLLAFCGAYEHEQQTRQPFDLDIDIETSFELAARTDELADTVDYGVICERLERLAASEKFALIEKMSQRCVDLIFETDQRISGVRLTLRKIRVPVGSHISSAGVSIYRTRS